tara:strand:- start:337 stop:2064 length:1728 start_codon:yes stop_codon:yes gene_type:complete
MCGIFALLCNNKFAKDDIIHDKWCNIFRKGRMRGPEHSIYKQHINEQLVLGFHRLAINGLDEISNQPITLGNITVICNGEIYNYKELYFEYGFQSTTNSDCEIIIHLYKQFGIEKAIELLDGVFAFVLDDSDKNIVHIGRDPFGVRPMYIFENESMFGLGSEMKVLHDLGKGTISHVPPGTYSSLSLNTEGWRFVKRNIQYYDLNIIYNDNEKINYTENEDKLRELYTEIRNRLISSVQKRVVTTDRPIACLLSGGLDSSLICALVQRQVNFLYPDKKVETYSIGLEGSEDLYYAERVAKYIGTKHTSVVVDELTFLNAIPDVVKSIETYDTTTIRASVGNYLVSKYISENSEAKVIFNGDGADELMGGYMYFHACPDSKEFNTECKRLLKNIHNYDVLRSDKSISSWGLEARTPLLDKNWVSFYLSLPIQLRNHNLSKGIEKKLIRTAFSYPLLFENKDMKPILPDEVLWRKKEAFSDGVSKQSRSWFQIIQESVELIDNLDSISIPKHLKTFGQPITQEQKYYYMLFHSNYPTRESILKYYWMPNYIKSTDSSARTLSVYRFIENEEEHSFSI